MNVLRYRHSGARLQSSPEIYEPHEHRYWEIARSNECPYRRVLWAVIELTIRDATRPTISGQRNYRRACEIEQTKARAFFEECSDEPKGWGWYIKMLGLEDWQIEWIERAAGVRVDDKTPEVMKAVTRSRRYAGSH